MNKSEVKMKIKKQKFEINHEYDNFPTNRFHVNTKSIISQDTISIKREHEDSIDSITQIKMKKKFGKPLIISQPSNEILSIPIPRILRVNKKLKASQNKSSILNNFIPRGNERESVSKITIGSSIIPEGINLKEDIDESSETNESNGINESMVLDEINNEPAENNTPESVQSEGKPHFYSLRNKVICVMEPKCKFSFNGKLKIKVLYGGVKIYGTIVKKLNTATPIEVYSPKGNNHIDIKVIELENSSDNSSDVWSALEEDNIDCNISNALQSHINNLATGWAVLLLQNFENNLTNFLEVSCNYKLFPKIEDTSNYSWRDIKRAEIILQSNIYCDDTTKEIINFSGVDETINKIITKCMNNENPKVIMAGGKSVGKSTTMRYLVNQILEEFDSVIVLDLDPGQAEFTPSECISLNIIRQPLLGPNFTHLTKPYYQIYVGSVDVTRCLSHYINAVRKLVEQLNTYLSTIKLPVIVNTMGFCRGVGWDIITSIIKRIQPTDIIQIVSDRSKNNFEQSLSHEVINRQNYSWAICDNAENLIRVEEYQLHIVNSQAEIKTALGEMWNIEPHQQREIVTLAYLSEIIKNKNNSSCDNDNTQININSIVPYEVPFSAMKLSLGDSTTSHVLSVMNGNIVALCGTNTKNNEDDNSMEVNSTLYPEVLIRLPLATCYGFGIVRGVDMEMETIYLNTPLSISELKHVNCLIGCMPVPSGLLQLNRSGVPYTGGDCNLPTSRDPRRGYFRMKYRNDT